MQRKDAILHSASDHFGRFGFRGASLRDIARDAGVSLPLLSHYFGDKAQLLSGVIAARRETLEKLVPALKRATWAAAGTFTADDLVHSWVRVAFDVAETPDGILYLRLVARILDDPAEESMCVVREHLEPAATAFISALQQCYPRASRRAAASACLCVAASLLNFLVNAPNVVRTAGAQRPAAFIDDATTRLASFLVAGIEAVISLPEADVEADEAASRRLSTSARSMETI